MKLGGLKDHIIDDISPKWPYGLRFSFQKWKEAIPVVFWWYMMVLVQYRSVLVGTWWHSFSIERYWLTHDGTGLVEGGTGWYLVLLGQYGSLLVGTWWYWVTIGRYWLIHDSTGSLWGGTGWYLVVRGQYRLVMVDICWYLVRRGRYWSVLGSTGSIEGETRSV